MPKGLCGRTLSLGLGTLIPSSRTTGSNLIAMLSEDTVMTWASGLDTQLQLIHKGTGRPRLPIRS